MKEIQTVALIGLGGIGCYIAESLKKALPYENLRIIAGGERKERLQKNGVVINGAVHNFHVVDPAEVTGFADLAIIITKFPALDQAILDMHNQIGPNTLILAPLNGVESEEKVAKVYGWDNLLYSLVRVSVVMKGNEATFNPNVAHFEYGETKNDLEHLTPRVQAIKTIFDKAGIVSKIQPDMLHAMWHKFMCNVSENQSAAILGLPFKAWQVSEHANIIREAAMREVVAVAAKKGVTLTEEDITTQQQRLMKVPPQNKPSTLQDIEAGRKTEVDMFAGTVMRLGREFGIPTPINDFFYHGIKVLEEKNEGLF